VVVTVRHPHVKTVKKNKTAEESMYRTADGEEIFIIDGHTHLWDGSKENLKNIHGQQFIDCFYGYHSALSPKEYVWPKEKFDKYGAETMYNDLFVEGYDDMAIFQPTYLKDFYVNGFNTTEQNAVLKEKYPDRFIMDCVTAFYAKCYRSVFEKRCMIGRSRGIDPTYA
jgi:hypothetical protein